MSTREDWMRRLGPLYGGAVALVHSTPWRWPGAIATGSHDRSAAQAAGWIVAVGVLIGVVAWIAAALVGGAGMPSTIASLVGLATLSLASAALVERGLAEQIDRWGGDTRPTAPSALATMVLVFATLVRAAAIIALPSSRWLAVLVAAAVVGRYAAVFLQAIGDPILDDDSPRSLVATPAPAWLTAALGVGVAVIAVLALGKAGIAAVAITAAIAFALGLDAQRRDRGLTAPVVATAAAAGELAVLLIATMGA